MEPTSVSVEKAEQARADWQRTVDCGTLRIGDEYREVVVCGWANTVRDHGGVTFLDLRDRTGIVQIVVDPSRNGTSEAAHVEAQKVKSEFCLSIRGRVVKRLEGADNHNLATGEIEIEAREVTILNPSRPLPFPLDQENLNVSEELRVKYRYLDLRRPAMYEKIRLRHQAVRLIREFMYRQDFLEVETPMMTRSSPEGARDYLVPYRLDPGKFYALPQAPQQYKQLLMVAGIERYFQVARCFRDESQRADRQPEFTQLDIEMSFVQQDDVLNLVESLYTEVIPQLTTKRLITPFTRLTYDEAMARYGSDKPDLRYGLELTDCGPLLQNTEFTVFRGALEAGGLVKAIRYPGGARIPRREMDELITLSREFGAKGMAYFLVDDDGGVTRGPVAKFLSDDEKKAIVAAAAAEPGDLVGFIADKREVVNKVLDRLRREIASRLKLADPDVLAFCWITDFPVFAWDEEAHRWTFEHNPFAMPHAAHLDLLETDPAACRAYCYDLACNGSEAASGSIRIHRRDIQERIFRMLGNTDEEIQSRFGHMLDAFDFGAPPHGGIAPGIDRLIMYLTDDDNIREVIAFPKMGGGYDPMMDAPSEVDPKQLAELGIRFAENPKETTK